MASSADFPRADRVRFSILDFVSIEFRAQSRCFVLPLDHFRVGRLDSPERVTRAPSFPLSVVQVLRQKFAHPDVAAEARHHALRGSSSGLQGPLPV